MDRQIVDPGLNMIYNAARAISTGDPHFVMAKNIYIHRSSKLRITMLDDTVLLLKNLVQF